MILEPCFYLCKNCINYSLCNNFAYCDIDNFNKSNISNSLLYTPLDFDCIEYEEYEDFNEQFNTEDI